MLKHMLLAAGLLIGHTCLSQKIQLINSGEVLESGKASYDSGNYKLAIKKYLTIQERDTNYITSLAELAISYLGSAEYDKAIEACDRGLKRPSESRSHLLRSKAIALDKSGDYAKSVALFEKTISEYPTDPLLIYNYGITLYNAKEYAKAKEYFFRTLSINPFHAGSHRGLARIAILEGRKVHGMLAMGIYLSINPNDNENLVMINNFVLNQAPDEGSLTGTGRNSYEKLDQIVRAKMAMDKNFQSKFSLEFAIVKQFEMILDQLDVGAGETNDAYRNLYTPLYKTFKEKNYVEPFIYNLVKSTGHEQAKKWLKKNEKTLNAFYDGAGAEIRTKRSHPVIPEAFGLGTDYTALYNDNGRLTSVGKKSADDKMIGKWYFFHYNMERSAEGSFDKNEEKTGTWKYYSREGKLTKVENHDTGEMKFYHPEGTIYQHFFLVKDSIEGEARVMYRCGSVKEKYSYKQNKRHGPAVNYFPDGKIESEYSYKVGKLDGEFKTYYENGKLQTVLSYRNGLAEGPYKKYFANGKLEISGQYANDEREGTWNYFYFNGKPDRTGAYVKSLGVGEWLFYNEHGEMIEKRNFDQKGNLHGENTFYANGKVHYVRTYKNNVTTKFVYFNDKGAQVGSFEKSNGDFAIKSYYPTGELSAEGALKAGKNHGKWKYYDRFGKLKSEFTYKEGDLHGPVIEYYPTGVKKSVYAYEEDRLHGYYQAFHVNGQVSSEGWYQNGDKQQQWLTYHLDGTLENDDYYLNGLATTTTAEFSVDGKILSRKEYDTDGNIVNVIVYNPDGKPGSILKESGVKKIYETYFSNKKPQEHIELACGVYYGPVTRWFPDGKPFYSYTLLNGKREGKFQYYDMRNQLEREGTYIDGWAEGVWKGYENGKLDYVGRYFNNNFDSTWTYYHPDGKVASIGNYFRGERHGLSSTFNAQGGPAVEKMYDNGDMISYRTYRADGTWTEWTRFTGNAVITAFFSGGTKCYEEEYKGGLLTGVKRQYLPNGKVFTETNFKDGDYEGPYVQYYLNGNLREKGQYKADEFHGKIEYYNEDGSLMRNENYNYGVRIGKATVFQKGVKSKEYTFWGPNVYE
jgi:uncharacterized protein